MTTTSTTQPAGNNAELLQLAIAKGKGLQQQTRIRLSADLAYFICNIGGRVFIGFDTIEPAELFFKNKPTMIMSDKDGKHIATVQRLF